MFVTKQQLIVQGIPTIVSSAFTAAADNTNSVIMTRVPGAATTTLIDEGYDLKGFFVKAKSCDWGPMEGFICEPPPFNKAGSKRIDDNLKDHKHAIDEFFKVNDENAKLNRSFFTPLKISATRKEQVVNKIANVYRLNDDKVFGIAHDRDNTVVIDFALVKELSGLWAMYFRNIFYKPWNEQTETLAANFVAYNPIYDVNNPLWSIYSVQAVTDFKSTIVLPNEAKSFLRAELQQLVGNTVAIKNDDNFYPIRGAQNPYPAYSGNLAYKNAISGDYDLFAIWPLLSEETLESAQRHSEIKLMEAGNIRALVGTDIFAPLPTKPLALELINNRNMYVEFIPSYGELTPIEHKQYGNISEITFLAAGMLNSIVADNAKRVHNAPITATYPNRAFHSDEGGRPGLKEIDYPVAVFLPKTLADHLRQSDNTVTDMLLITNHTEFMRMVYLLKGKCYIFFNSGWLPDLLNAAIRADNSEQAQALKASVQRLFWGNATVPVDQIQTAMNQMWTSFTALTYKKRDNENPPIHFNTPVFAKMQHILNNCKLQPNG